MDFERQQISKRIADATGHDYPFSLPHALSEHIACAKQCLKGS
jgi:hypothetical protein